MGLQQSLCGNVGDAWSLKLVLVLMMRRFSERAGVPREDEPEYPGDHEHEQEHEVEGQEAE
jgi:hypothetical protein